MLPEKFTVLGVSRSGYSDESFREKLQKALEDSENVDQVTLNRVLNRAA